MTSIEAVSRPAVDGLDQRKTAAVAGRNAIPAPGAIRLADAASIRTILRSDHTTQAGFGAGRVKLEGNIPVILADGEPHRLQRSATARFFSPKAVATRYRPLMESLSDTIVGRIHAAGGATLETETMELAVGVAADIIGLTHGDRAGLSRRLEAIFRGAISGRSNSLSRLMAAAKQRYAALNFLFRDVRPAVRARQKAPDEDLISHLMEQGYSDTEILTECLVYAAAGMVTTREFIVVAAWHMLDRPELRDHFLAASQSEQMTMLEEILRAEPVVGIIARRLNGSIDLPGGNGRLEAGSVVELDLRGANSDAAMVGPSANCIDFSRAVAGKHPSAMFSFGDGAHRCPGAAVAMLESAIFLDRLMRLPGLHLTTEPDVGWAAGISGYELSGAVIRCDKL